MNRRVSRLSLRVRLVAGFSVAMLVLLIGAGAFVYWRVEYALDRGLDSELKQATSVIVPLIGADGTVSSPEAADATGVGVAGARCERGRPGLGRPGPVPALDRR